MTPRIDTLREKKLIGAHLEMSLAADRTRELWQQFMPRIKEIENRTSGDKISLQIYREPLKMGDFTHKFEKWAAVEVANFDSVPEGLETLMLPGGVYAVFDYKGSSGDPQIFRYIFTEWLPRSAYALDDRPHFEVLGEKYRNNDPESEEEIWIPVKLSLLNYEKL
jgi:AraC family transcriptional regulator